MNTNCKKMRSMLLILSSSFAVLSAANVASASEDNKAKLDKPDTVVLAPPSDYCQNVLKPVQEARYAFQLKTLENLQKVIDTKIAVMNEQQLKNSTFEAKQKEKAKAAQQLIVDIYSKMKPDIAASQMELLDPEIAAAILDQLKAKNSSSILNEMKGQSAAVITAIMADGGKMQQP